LINLSEHKPVWIIYPPPLEVLRKKRPHPEKNCSDSQKCFSTLS
jgi:hypothetical protein